MAIPRSEIHETKVHLNFHIYTILEFDNLIGYPIEKKFQQKPFLGSHDEKLGKTASTIHIPSPKNPKAKQHPNHNTFEDLCSFQLSLLVKQNVYHLPRSNINHIPLANMI
jgi:hypothetical protein